MEHALLVGRVHPYLMEENNKYSQFILDHGSYQLCAEAQLFLFTIPALQKKARKYQNQS